MQIEDGFLREQQSIMEQWNYEQQIASSMGHGKMVHERNIRDEQCRLNTIKRKKIKDAEERADLHAVEICKKELINQEDERLQRIRDQRARNEENMTAVKSQFGKRAKAEKEEKAEDHRVRARGSESRSD